MATYTVSNTGGNWVSGGTWVGGVAPGSTDDVIFTATSGNLTVTANASCRSIDFTNYVGTFTVNSAVTFTVGGTGGNVTLAGTCTYVAGSASTSIVELNPGASGTLTLTSNGVTFPISTRFRANNAVFTLADNAAFSGTLLLGVAGNGTLTINGNQITASGGLTLSGNNTASDINNGTTTLILTGGTWQHPAAGGLLQLNTTIAGNITVSGTVHYNTGTLTYSSGSVTIASSTLSVNKLATLNTSGMNWNNVNLVAVGATITLSSNLNVNGLLTLSAASSGTTTINGFQINAAGGITQGGSSSTDLTTGNTVLNWTGGTWSQSNSGQLRLPLNINGTVAVSGSVTYNTGTITYVSGTLSPGTSTLTISGNTTINTGSSVVWNNVTFTSGSNTYTLSSDLYASGTVTIAGTSNLPVFNGFSIYASGGVTCTLTTGNTSGTTTLRLVGTGTLDLSALTTGSFRMPIVINTSGTITIANGGRYQGGTITYTAGTVNHSGTLTLSSSATFDTNGMSWNSLTFSSAATLTLTSALRATGTVTISAATVFTTSAFDINTLVVCSTFTIPISTTNRVRTALYISGGLLGLVTIQSSSASTSTTMTLDSGGESHVIYANAIDINSAGGRTIVNLGTGATNTRTTNWTTGSLRNTVAFPSFGMNI